MTTARVNFYVLDVGQGSLNYVEVLDTTGAVTNNMIIDIGTDSPKAVASDNMKWLANRIKGRVSDPRLDVLVLTHGDTDHYNLLVDLLPAFNPKKKTRIGKIRYGGDANDYKVGSPLSKLKAYCSDIKGFSSNSTGYDPSDLDPWSHPIWAKNDVELRLLVANLPVRTKAGKSVKNPRPDARKNTGSAVLGVYWDRHWYICTGDGTGTTLAGANSVFDGHAADMPFTFLMTTPHHGSFKTTYNLASTSSSPSNLAIKVVDTFAGTFNPFTVSASAGEKNHHHASMFVVEQLSKYTKKDANYWSDSKCGGSRHFITTWIDYHITGPKVTPAFPVYDSYVTTQTEMNLYTTHYFIESPYNDSVTKSGKKKTKVHTYPYQYITPPEWAVNIAGGTKATGVPFGRNYTFYMTATNLGVTSAANTARTAANSLVIVPSAPPPSFTTAPGRSLRAATKPPLPQPALSRALPPLDPGFHPLKTLRTVS